MNLPLNSTADTFLGKLYDRNHRPLIMGIINASPDSFYVPNSLRDADLLRLALRFISEGADILDIGGESSRPGSTYISVQEELDRVLPVITSIRRESDIAISVDTRKYEVAREAVSAGANCINDISALRDDADLGTFIAEYNLPVILMHMQGTPKTMQDDPQYHDVVLEVKNFFQQRIEYAQSIDIPCERIIIDPGIGFGKSHSHNLQLLKHLDSIVEMGFPVLIGHSRKSFIGRILGQHDAERQTTAEEADEQEHHIRRPEERLYGSLGVVADSYIRGSRIFRVHDVAETRDLLETMYRIGASAH